MGGVTVTQMVALGGVAGGVLEAPQLRLIRIHEESNVPTTGYFVQTHVQLRNCLISMTLLRYTKLCTPLRRSHLHTQARQNFMLDKAVTGLVT